MCPSQRPTPWPASCPESSCSRTGQEQHWKSGGGGGGGMLVFPSLCFFFSSSLEWFPPFSPCFHQWLLLLPHHCQSSSLSPPGSHPSRIPIPTGTCLAPRHPKQAPVSYRGFPSQGFAGVSLRREQLAKGVPPPRSLLRRSQEIIGDKQEPASAEEMGGTGGTGVDSSVPRASPGSRGDRRSMLPVSEGLGGGSALEFSWSRLYLGGELSPG